MIEIHFIRANKGDSFLIKHKNASILIDGGTRGVYRTELKKKLNELTKIDLVVVTHIDDDHIGGIINLFKDDRNNSKVKKVFFNSGSSLENNLIEEREINIDEICEEKSFKQGETLEKKLLQLGIWKREEIILGTQKIEIEEVEIEVLSPLKKDLEVLSNNWDIEKEKYINEIKNKELKSGKLITKYKDIDELINYSEDTSITAINKTSIVLLITIEEKKMLFTGDTSEENLKEALIKLGYSKENPIKLDLFKLPHHGSKNNMSKELIEMIDCKMYLVSTNGKSHGHPDKEVLAKIIDFNKDKNIEIVFNYSVFDNIFSDKDKEKYSKFECKEKQIIQL